MLALRILSAVIFFILVFLSLAFPALNWIIHVIIALATVIGTLEYFSFLKKKELHPPVMLGVVIALSILWLAHVERMIVFPVLMIAALILIGLLHMLQNGYKDFIIESGSSLFGCFYVSVPMAFVLIIFKQQDIAVPAILFCVLVCWASDTGAYTIGRIMGKRKLVPKLSPGKTIEGSIGGVVFSLITAMLLCLVSQKMSGLFPLPWAVFLAIVFSVFGQAADLLESAMKRDAGVKDSGNAIPGHGGMLDVIDSLLVCGPILFVYLLLSKQIVLN